MSKTVSIPANMDFSLFQSGAETTANNDVRCMRPRDNWRQTVEEQALKSFLDVELCIKYYQPEANRKGVVGCVYFEKGSNSMQGGIV